MEILTRFARKPLFFSDPLRVIVCHEARDLPAAFRELERALAQGRYLAGFMSYEAGYAFEERLRPLRPRDDFPLLQFGVYTRPQRLDPVAAGGKFTIRDLTSAMTRRTYAGRIAAIHRHIAAGDVYQITFCRKKKFNYRGNPAAGFAQLLAAQPVPYAARVHTNECAILSLSPERFVRKRGPQLLTEPMKGTWWRGATPALDRAARREFARDPKNRAENVMIADLLRNDLGRIGHAVRAPKLFTVTGYRTLFQMTSTVTARCARHLPLYDLCAALFPSGSVTGAPKIRAMEIIRELEPEPRRIYTGAIGYVTPGRDLYFNIPIRTLLLRRGRGEMGIGGGIIWDSTAPGEWAEGELKASFLEELQIAAPGNI